MVARTMPLPRKARTFEPDRVTINPIRQISGLRNQGGLSPCASIPKTGTEGWKNTPSGAIRIRMCKSGQVALMLRFR